MQIFPRCLSLLLILALTACGGRTPVPVIIHQLGDEDKTCEEIAYELDNIQKKVTELLPGTKSFKRNMLSLGAAVFFTKVAIIFMDLSQADQYEVVALHKRYNYMLAIARRKDCLAEDFSLPPLPQPLPPKTSY